MKKALRLTQSLIGGCLGLLASSQTLALPIVESRTGEPTLRSPQEVSSSPRIYDDSPYSRLQQIEALKEELNVLRGLMEEKNHALEMQIQALKKSQQDFYVDLDKRLTPLEPPKTGSIRTQGSSAVSTKTTKAAPLSTTVQRTPTATVVAKPVLKTEDAETRPVEEGDQATLTPSAVTTDNPTTSTVEPTTTVTTNLTEKACYEAASASLSARNYPSAIEGFQRCVARYPQGSYTAQCYYWLGESYMAQWGSHKEDKTLLDKASQSFLMVTTRFPTHPRATDALLKLGIVEQEKGNLDVSKRYFEQVRDRYPDSAAARMAESYLQED